MHYNFTPEELALGEQLFRERPDRPWLAFCELVSDMPLHKRQALFDLTTERMAGVYHVETLVRIASGGGEFQPPLEVREEWQTFTEQPIWGEKEAKAHLKMVQDASPEHGSSPDRVRLRELTVEDVVLSLSPEEKDDLLRRLTTMMKPHFMLRMIGRRPKH